MPEDTATLLPEPPAVEDYAVADGLYENIPDPDYRKWTDPNGALRMSKSTLEHARPGDGQQDMLKLKMVYDGEWQRPDTGALSFGRAFDTRLLDPQLYREQYTTMPAFGDMRTKKAKEARDAWTAENADKEPVSRDESHMIEAMAAAVYDHKVVRLIRKEGGVQTSLAWTDDKTGVPMRARLDKRVFFKKTWWVIDVKSARDCKDQTVRRQITDFGYHRQAAIYSDGHLATAGTLPVFLFVFVSKEDVPVVRTEILDPAYIELGRVEYRDALRQWKAARAAGVYPRPYPDIHELEAPRWVRDRIETFGGIE